MWHGSYSCPSGLLVSHFGCGSLRRIPQNTAPNQRLANVPSVINGLRNSPRPLGAVGATAPCYKEATLVNLPKAGVGRATAWLTVNPQAGCGEASRELGCMVGSNLVGDCQVKSTVPCTFMDLQPIVRP